MWPLPVRPSFFVLGSSASAVESQAAGTEATRRGPARDDSADALGGNVLHSIQGAVGNGAEAAEEAAEVAKQPQHTNAAAEEQKAESTHMDGRIAAAVAAVDTAS